MDIAGASVLSRRQYLVGGATAAVGAVAGCTEAIDRFADEILEEVNLFNETERRLTGSITVTGPSGTTRLDESFTLDPESSDEEGNEDDSNLNVYADIWTSPGEYDVAVEFDEPVEGETAFSETVRINDPEDEILVIPVGADEFDATVDFRVGESFSDTWPE